jgi:hypothetical protein
LINTTLCFVWLQATWQGGAGTDEHHCQHRIQHTLEQTLKIEVGGSTGAMQLYPFVAVLQLALQLLEGCNF